MFRGEFPTNHPQRKNHLGFGGHQAGGAKGMAGSPRGDATGHLWDKTWPKDGDFLMENP